MSKKVTKAQLEKDNAALIRERDDASLECRKNKLRISRLESEISQQYERLADLEDYWTKKYEHLIVRIAAAMAGHGVGRD